MSRPLSTPNWFSGSASQFFAALLPQLGERENFRALQIGCFVGDASVWLAENIPNIHLDDVDTWEGSEDIHGIDFNVVESFYDEQTAPFAERITKYKMRSAEFLRSLPLAPIYDFIYIDGDHTAVGCLEDAVAAWPRLKINGFLAFDDYSWRDPQGRPLFSPYPAIDAFMSVYADRCERAGDGDQVWLYKTA